VLRIEAKILMLERHVSGEDVIAFIEAERLALDGVQELEFENQKQEHDGGYLHPGSVQQGLQAGGVPRRGF
jgi:hypothetical protein